jgi:hypothetical protein
LLSHSDWLCPGFFRKSEVLALNDCSSIFGEGVSGWKDRLHSLLGWLPDLGTDLEYHLPHLAKTLELDIVLGGCWEGTTMGLSKRYARA